MVHNFTVNFDYLSEFNFIKKNEQIKKKKCFIPVLKNCWNKGCDNKPDDIYSDVKEEKMIQFRSLSGCTETRCSLKV